MNSLSPKTVLLLVMFALQLFVPASMIGKREATLRAGTPYKFKTRPVDPHDPFRGRYVALNFEEDKAGLEGEKVKRGERIFVEVHEGEDGFAELGKATTARPEAGDYIKAHAGYSSGGNSVNVRIAFNRYYMNEKRAPEAERAYWQNNRGTNQNTFALVKVLDGMAVIEGLYIDGVHVLDYIEQNQKQ